MPFKEIVIQPCAGFANRFRAIASAAALAAELLIPLRIRWTQEWRVCIMKFTDCFDIAALPDWIRFEEGPPMESAGQHMVRCQADLDAAVQLCSGSGSGPVLSLKSYSQFYTKDQKQFSAALQLFRPTAAAVAAVAAVLGPTPRSIIGIHIRRTDNATCIRHSPTKAFVDAIDYRLSVAPESRFFIASDDDSERRALVERYGAERILMLAPAGSLNRHTEEGGFNAFLDFLALSMCGELWGSVYSSFSEIAAVYGKCGYFVQLGTPLPRREQ